MNTKHCLGLAFAALLPFGAAHGAASTPQKEVVASKDAPAAVGPYSQAIRSGGMVFLAGQIPIDPKTGQANTARSRSRPRRCSRT